MKKYLAHWNNFSMDHYLTVEAENATKAKHKAFQMMCDRCGDRIYTLTIYEQKLVCDCGDELNPSPTSAMTDCSCRDYYTGNRIKPKRRTRQ